MYDKQAESACKLEVQDIWRLHLTRNAIMPEKTVADWNSKDNAVRFYMFDYFDRLVCRRVNKDRDDHRFCFGLNQPQDAVPPTASHYLTLLNLKGDSSGAENPFCQPEEAGATSNSLSDKPFLSIILVTIVPGGTKEDTESSTEKSAKLADIAGKLEEKELQEFLRDCVEKLREAAKAALEQFQGKNADRNAGMICGIYHCVNSGNFCVAVRTNCPELSYYIAMSIRDTTLNAKDDMPKNRHFPLLSCWTFTLTGMEYREGPKYQEDMNGPAISLKESYSRKIDANVVMRFGLPDHTLIQEMYQQKNNKADSVEEEIRTLYGRYDVTLTLKMETFQRIYPWICAGKFRAGFPKSEAPENEPHSVIKSEKDPVIKSLMEALKGGDVQAVNERILLNPEDYAPIIPEDYAFKALPKKRQELVREEIKRRQELVRGENLAVMRMIEDLLKKADGLPYCRDEYCHCLHLLRDLWKSYSNLRYQDDSFINGNMFLAQIWLVLDCVEKYVDSSPEIFGKKHPDKIPDDISKDMLDSYRVNQQAYYDLMTYLRGTIQSISHFQKLMQSINQQSLMAPNYEVQMHTDLEKFMVAYTEFSRRFMSFHFRKEGTDGKSNDKQYVLPVFMMDVLNKSIKARPKFLLPYWQNQEGLCRSNPEQERLLLSIVLPDIETCGDLYSTLPLICHELSHNFRIASRADRNEALAHFILSKVADYVAKLWVFCTSDQPVYWDFGLLRRWLSFTIAECLYRSYGEYCGIVCEKANIGAFNSNMKAFLMNCFFVDVNETRKRSMTASEAKNLLSKLYGLYRSSSEAEQAEWYADFQACCCELDAIEEKREGAIERNRRYDAVSKKLKSVAKVIHSAIIEQQAYNVGRAAVALAKYKEEKLNSSQLKAALRNLSDEIERIYRDPDIIKKIYPEAENADRWIVDTLNRMTIACQEVEQTIKQAYEQEPKPSYEKMKLLIKGCRYAVLESCTAIKDANYFFNVLDGLLFEPFLMERNILLGRIHNQLRRDIQMMQLSQTESTTEKIVEDGMDSAKQFRSLWPIFSSPQMRKLLAPVCIDMEDPTLLRQTLLENVLRVQSKTVITLVEDAVTIYREVFADLGMCLSLGLDEFGYLMVMSYHSPFYREVQERDTFHSLPEQVEMVCWTLLSKLDKYKSQSLAQKIWKYYRSMKDHIKSRVTASGWKKLQELFFDPLEKVLDNPESAVYIKNIPSLLDASDYLMSPSKLFKLAQSDIYKRQWQRLFCRPWQQRHLFRSPRQLQRLFHNPRQLQRLFRNLQQLQRLFGSPQKLQRLFGSLRQRQRLFRSPRQRQRLFRNPRQQQYLFRNLRPTDNLFQIKQDLSRELERELEHLWMAVYFTSHIRHVIDQAEHGVWKFNQQVTKHFEHLWEIMERSWTETERHLPSSHVLRKIGMAYNRGEVEPFLRKSENGEAETPNSALKDTLSFILFYYYQNWSVYSEWDSFAPFFNAGKVTDEEVKKQRDHLNGWLDRLMGGESVNECS